MHTLSSPPPGAWRFAKMHGAGNDFVVLDAVSQPIELTPELARRLADRHFGIGADQILIVENPMHPEADFRYRIFNADGGEVEHCGNGARCFARFVREQGLSRRNPLRAEICTGLLTLTLEDSGEVSVDMGQVSFEPGSLPFDPDGLASRRQGDATIWQLPLDGLPTVEFAALAISNPHAVLIVDDVATAPVGTLGPAITHHPRFANEVNTGFLQVVDRHNARLRVYERGAGETLACGTGACAAAITGIRMGLLDSPVKVQTRGGCLTIAWNETGLRMSGPATTVFQGWIDPHALVRPTEFKDIAA
ncbi:diaminopimelate epimerase [Paracandidimonas soli]|uniref:Diaminopimelate epimerase n=1 Tax=Paracandidimonas soli TaxID=1917182 RepID=A0A4R3VGT5_9BURK|nr:diaminopimelate epimerase [Paracandidimonas soli]TCV02929.1 diaminopimelate epimerase [Paracandidimonas soli]